jgi:hypothetical protein
MNAELVFRDHKPRNRLLTSSLQPKQWAAIGNGQSRPRPFSTLVFALVADTSVFHFLVCLDERLERELAVGWALELGYVGSKGTHLGRQPIGSLATYQATGVFPRLIAGINTVNYYSFGANSRSSPSTSATPAATSSTVPASVSSMSRC